MLRYPIKIFRIISGESKRKAILLKKYENLEKELAISNDLNISRLATIGKQQEILNEYFHNSINVLAKQAAEKETNSSLRLAGEIAAGLGTVITISTAIDTYSEDIYNFTDKAKKAIITDTEPKAEAKVTVITNASNAIKKSNLVVDKKTENKND